MATLKKETGDFGENVGIEYLVKKGYKIVAKNYRFKNFGEIDLVAKKNGKLIFFEVKTRNKLYSLHYPTWTSITIRKRRSLRRICNIFIQNNKEYTDKDWRVDVLFIELDGRNVANIEHLENILWESYY